MPPLVKSTHLTAEVGGGVRWHDDGLCDEPKDFSGGVGRFVTGVEDLVDLGVHWNSPHQGWDDASGKVISSCVGESHLAVDFYRSVLVEWCAVFD